MEYIKVLPEIIEGLGENTTFNNDTPQKEVTNLHIEIENWLGDDLLWNFPEVVVTQRLKEDLGKNIFSGFSFKDMEITKDEYFDDNYDIDEPLPDFYWMRVKGNRDQNDIFIEKGDLFLSRRLLDYLKKEFNLKNIEENPEEAQLTDFIKELIEKDKKTQYTSLSLADQEHLSGNTYEAIQILKNAFEDLPEPKKNFGEASDILLRMAEYQAESKNFEAAFKTLDKLERYLNADDSEAIALYRAKVHYLAGDTKKAFDEFQTFKLRRGMKELQTKYPEYYAIFQKLF